MCAHCDRMLPVGAAMWHHPTIWGGAWCSHRRVRRRQQESPDPQTSHDAHSPSPWQPDFCFTSERRDACSNNHTSDSLSMLCVLRLKDTWKILCYSKTIIIAFFFFACSCIYSMWYLMQYKLYLKKAPETRFVLNDVLLSSLKFQL